MSSLKVTAATRYRQSFAPESSASHPFGARRLIASCIGALQRISLQTMLIFSAVTGGTIVAAPQSAMAEVVCSRAGSEFDFNGGYVFGGDVTSGMRAKLGNSNYFGPGGTVAPEPLTFSTLAILNASTLSACSIYIGGGFEEDGNGVGGSSTGTLSVAEANALKAWSDLGGERFVIGGCDRASNRTCTVFGRSLTGIGNAAITVDGGLANNPLTCGGGGSPLTFGGASTDIGTLPGDAVLATHTIATSIGEPAATTDDLSDPAFLFTADADMFGSSGNATINDSPIASNDQAIFVLNVFKFALDGMKGRLASPFCPTDYNTRTDLELALSGSSAGTTTTVTIEVANVSGTTTSNVEVTAPIPVGFTFVGASGTGTYNSGTGKWIVGTMAGTSSTTITLTLTRTSSTPAQMTAEITRQSLADVDSAPNSSFNADDLDDGLADDDEATLSFVDYGDAEVSYGAPSHAIDSALRLGATIDGDASTQNSVNADGDDNDGGDDEDGVTIPTLTQGTSATIPVSVTQATSSSGRLQGWIDWNGDGTFDAGEQIASNLQTASAGTSTINIDVIPPYTATTNQTFARFRWSTTGDLDSTMAASDGEVEDYTVTVAAGPPTQSCSGYATMIYDPNTTLTDNGYDGFNTPPSNPVGTFDYDEFANTEQHLSIKVTEWGNASSMTDGVGDDSGYTNTPLDDNDWDRAVDFTRTIQPGEAGDYSVELLAGDDHVFIFKNGTQIYAQANAYNIAPMTLPNLTLANNDILTIRVVEEHLGNTTLDLQITPLFASNCTPEDYSDAPTTGTSYGDAMHEVVAGIQLGDLIDADAGSLASPAADGDGADDDGVSSFPDITALGTSYRLPATNISATGTGTLHGWIDFDGDGTFTVNEYAETTVTNGALSGDLFWKGQTIMGAGTTFARLRFTSDTGVSATTPSGSASDGEVEDYQVTVATPPPSPNVPFAICAIPNFSSVAPDGLEDTTFPTGYWAASYYEGRDGISGSSVPNSSTGTNSAGSKTFHGEAFWGDGENPVRITLNGSDPSGRWSNTETPTSPLLPHPSYTGSTWTGSNPHYQVDYRRTVDADGVITAGGDPDDVVDDSFEVFVNGTRVYVYASVLASSIPQRPTPTNKATIPVSAGDEVLIRHMNLGFIGGLQFNFTAPGYDCSDTPLTYGTAAHEASAQNPRLGAEIDIDSANIASLDASGDGADDDGVTLPATFEPGTTISLPITVTGAGFLNAWIDWNGNGVFDEPTEQIATDVQNPGGSGTINLPVTIPSGAVVGQTFARFRWSSAFDIGINGPAPDGEVEDYQITINDTSPMLSGTLFIDNGIGGAVAHDGLIGGAELGAAVGTIALLDGSGNPLSSTTVNADGTWSAMLPVGYSGTVQVVAIANPGYRIISEDRSAVPGASNVSETDGTYSFNATAGTSYSGLNIGLIAEPTLTQNQSASATPGQIIELPHVYTATTSGTVDFALLDQIANPAGAFTSAVFEDTNCDGFADQIMPAGKVVAAGDQLCLVVRTQSGAGISPGASYTYGITATTAYSSTMVTHVARNDDAIGRGSSGDLVLRKLVTNLSQPGALEGISNTGDIGDVLQYRIVFTNPGVQAANDIRVNDQTPAYTALSSAIPTAVTVAPGITCNLQTPSTGNNTGYTGPIQWQCPGAFPPGEEGSVTFQVTISP